MISIRSTLAVCLALGLGSQIVPSLRAQDMALSDILVAGESWQVMSEGHAFTDAACADAAGNFYFSDVSKGGGIMKISPDGKVSVHFADTPKVSGLKFGPDGRLYACAGATKQVLVFDTAGKMSVLASDVQPNDLVVTKKGWVYFTETGKKQVTSIDPQGKVSAADVGIAKPNGIALSPNQDSLGISDYGGSNVYVFRIETDGSLTAKSPYMTLRLPFGKAESLGDGMTTDAVGRWYVTSAEGVQIFDPTGRMSGVLAKPQNKGAVSVALAGTNMEYLYLCCADKVYRRKTQAHGVAYK